MKEFKVKVDKEECKDTCPIPLELIPNVLEGVEKIKYDDKRKEATIRYDEDQISKSKIIRKLKEVGYNPKE